MQIRYLEAFGVLPEIIDLWEKGYGSELLPIQERAVKEYGVLDGKSLVVLGATSSGKTFIAEMASAKRACAREKVIYAVSLKSLAEEKFRQFRKMYGDFGIRVAVSHRDRREFDYAIEQGHFEIAIVVYEKLHGLLIRNPDLLRETRLVVIDELQMLGDEDRGADLELLLTMMIEATRQSPLQIIGLSAVLNNPEEIARWLKAQLLVHYARPVELRKGVLCDGVYQYREHNTGTVGQEFFLHRSSPLSLSRRGGGGEVDPYHSELILETVRFLAEEKNESSIVFVPTKALARQWAEKLSEKSKLAPAKSVMESLREYEESAAREVLLKTLDRGMGYHNADLPMEIREVIERGFQSGEIKILFATSTLGQGLNFAAQNTVIVPEIYKYSVKSGGLLTYAIPPSQLENQGGRAGRYGYSAEFGRMILIAESEHEKTMLWAQYINGRSPENNGKGLAQHFELLHPALAGTSWETQVLRLVSSGWCKTEMEINQFFEKTLSAPLFPLQAVATGKTLADKIKQNLETLENADFLSQSPEGNLTVTEWGQICASSGVRIQTMEWIKKWISYFDGSSIELLELLLMLAFTEDAMRFRIPIREGEVRSNYYRSQLLKRVHDRNMDSRKLIEPLLKESVPLPKEKTGAIKKTLVLQDWITEMETVDLERKYNLHAGMIRLLAGDMVWLLRVFMTCVSNKGWTEEQVKNLELLAEKLNYGVTESGLVFARLPICGLGRNHIHALVRAGFEKPEVLKEMPLLELSRIIPETLAEKILSQLNENMPEIQIPKPIIQDYTRDRICLTGKAVKRRTVVVMNGKELELINSSYLVLLKLARALQNQRNEIPQSGWIHRDELDSSDQWRNISRLRCALMPFLIDVKEPVIDNDNMGYYRLRLHPENLVIEEENHQQHWNHEFHPLIHEKVKSNIPTS